MGHYDESWKELPKRFLYDAILQFSIVVIHLILPILIYISKQKEEQQDVEQRFNGKKADCNIVSMFFNKHLRELTLNYLLMGLIFSGYIVITKLHK